MKMMTVWSVAVVLVLGVLIAPAGALEKREISPTLNVLIVYEFSEPDIQKKLGVDFGAWELHPSYATDVEVVMPTDEKEAQEFGGVLKVSYNVAVADKDLPYASYPVYNGVWFHLADTDMSDYDTLVFYVRGDAKEGFTKRFKVEIKNNDGEVASFYVHDIGSTWRRIEIPISMFRTRMSRQLKSLKSMKELTVVFEKDEVTEKKGVIYLDNIYFSGPKDGIKKTVPSDAVVSVPAKDKAAPREQKSSDKNQ